jgi:hypothetical protein
MGDPYLLRSEARIAFQLNLLYYLTKQIGPANRRADQFPSELAFYST